MKLKGFAIRLHHAALESSAVEQFFSQRVLPLERALVREAQRRYERYRDRHLETVPAEDIVSRLRN